VAAPQVAGHFAGLFFPAGRLDPADPDFADRGPAAAGAMIPQQAVEGLLGVRAAELGVELRGGTEVTGLTAGDDGVTVTTSGGDLRAGWLVGCDGGRSLVRQLTGFGFPGTAPQITGHQAMVDLTGAEALQRGWHATENGLYAYGPAPGRILTVEFGGPPADRDAPVTAAELQASLRAVTGSGVTVTAVHSATRWTDHARQAETYRRGRVLLAGDAAHVHSPFSGQGLNLGLGDAMNLGWKLAGEVHGWAPAGLLDSYTAERHPIGAWVLDWTRAQTALLRPEPGARALRSVLAGLIDTDDGARYMAKRTSGVWQHYDLGGHPLTGRSAPDLTLADGTRLGELLAGGRGLLLDLADDQRLRDLARNWTTGREPGRIRVATGACPDRPGLAALLVRPDGFVAWASDSREDHKGLEDGLRRWFGDPAHGAEQSIS
jgi:2-polyprenyl-6-methoxyphenol hydroxylase-like FAD-dependent oxidoreductase